MGALESMGAPAFILAVVVGSIVALINVEQDGAAASSETNANGDFFNCNGGSDGSVDAADAVICAAEIVGFTFKLLFNAITFNVPGAPWWIRVPMSGLIIGGLIFGMAGAFS